MRRSLVLLAVGMVFGILDSRPSLAQRHEIPQMSSCIKESYDSEMYNWLTFKNVCTEGVTLVFVSKDGSGVGGTMDLRAGAKDSVGKLAGVKPKIGGFEFYVCPLGSVPTADDGKVVSRPGVEFKCKAKGE